MLKSFVRGSMQIGENAVAAASGKKFVPAVLAFGTALSAGFASAAVDTTDVTAALTAAQTSGETVGTKVIGVVAGLCVIGVIIALVRKV